MPKIYKRNCKYCGRYYKGEGVRFCSVKCARKSWKYTDHHKRKISEGIRKAISQGRFYSPFFEKSYTKGRQMSELTKEKISEIRKKQGTPWMKGKKQPWTTKRNLENNPARKPEVRLKMSLARKGKIPKVNIIPKLIKLRLRGLIKRPTKPERKLIEIIKKNNLPFIYSGNGKIIIETLNPDFIDNDGSKKIIEVFGDYWHNNPKTRYIQTEEGRKEVFAKYGFKTLVIWEHELKNLSEEEIVNKIKMII